MNLSSRVLSGFLISAAANTRHVSTRLVSNKSFAKMPKKMKQNKQHKQQEGVALPNASVTSELENAVVQNDNGSISIKVLAKPGAKQNGITSITAEGVGIQIAAPPVDGEANTALVKYVAQLLGLKKSEVRLDKGSKSRNKVLLLHNTGITVEDIISRLELEKES